MKPGIQEFFDPDSNTYSYVVFCQQTNNAAVIDPVLNFDAAACRTATHGVTQITDYLQQHQLTLQWILETHVHADHLSAAPYLKQQLGGSTAIGRHITEVQQVFAGVFHTEPEFCCNGSQFDHLLDDNEQLPLGELSIQVLHTPGHTPACVSYLIGDAVFVGDTLFMPDYGSARCDFPGGSAEILYQSAQRLFALPKETRMFLCHDYKAAGRNEFCFQTTIGEQINANIHLHQGVSQAEFVQMREQRDATLSMPKLMLPAVQVNMRAGQFPKAEENGVQYLKLPINRF
ncbi:MBL fold metallo-hydrolase [Rheinheimera sp. SA_1]|uniref:MBL fold metallo-hydrolase n=1 Tax=Rheinheimera sp. SA_1 TaxID=1827365 RepID=UPI0008004D6B|nr:MBL fold metallo-hydrolase [Rheinheimera sp. SA_1]OBP14429.1 MBL fold metallo-hydrolase [Rheinheimera sp. SA_1]